MARAHSVDSSPKRRRSPSVEEVPASEDEGDANSEEVDNDEYEIEEIVNSRRNRSDAEQQALQYFVKWKGYPSGENSWVDEQDAANAKELIDAYWTNAPKNKLAHKKAKQKRKSSASPPPPKKRGRPSRSSVAEQSEAESAEVDEAPPAKRGRKTTAKRQPSEEQDQIDQLKEEDESMDDDSAKYPSHLKGVSNWDHLVKDIFTVESEDTGVLTILFSLDGEEGGLWKVLASEGRTKFPNKLFDFYESNLRWKAIEHSK